MQSNTFCGGCFKAVGGFFVKCIVCNGAFHKLCSGIDSDFEFKFLQSAKNVAYKCNGCSKASKDLVAMISMLSKEIIELKLLFHAYIGKNNISESVSSKKIQANTSGVLLNNNNNVSESRKNPTRAVVVAADHADNLPGVSHSSPTRNVNTVRNVNTLDAVGDAVNSLHGVSVYDGNATVSVNQSNNNANAVTLTADNSKNNAGWTNVNRRKNHSKKPSKSRRVIVGESNNMELDVVIRMKWVHLSSFKPSVTEDNITDYVVKYLSIDKMHLKCYKLIKKDFPEDNLKFVNFKLGVSPDYYQELFKPGLWTSDIKVRPFEL